MLSLLSHKSIKMHNLSYYMCVERCLFVTSRQKKLYLLVVYSVSTTVGTTDQPRGLVVRVSDY